MRVFIFGVSQVGKSTTGKLLAERLGLEYFDLDFIIMDQYGSVENFMAKFKNPSRRFKKKADMIITHKNKHDNFVMAISPIYSIFEHERLAEELEDDICITLTASVETIFDRVGFYDENAVLLPNSDEIKNKYRNHYLQEIALDNTSNYNEFSYYAHINTDNLTVSEVVEKIINYINE